MEGLLVLLVLLQQMLLLSGDLVQSKKQQTSGSQQVLSFTSILEPPFLILNRGPYGELSYEGFIPDLIQKVAKRLRVPYKMHTVKNGAYGVPSSDGTWNGMIGEVMRGEASAAGGALSVRPARQEVVDFTEPFMTVGIKAVFKRPNYGETLPVSSIPELVNQTSVRYGVIDGSMTMWFFKAARDSTLTQMWNEMTETEPSGLAKTAAEGVERVRRSNGSFAFMLESTFADYLVNHPPCDLMTLEQTELLNPNSYAFAVKKGSPLKQKMSRAIRALKRRGEMEKLYNKWWKTDCVELKKTEEPRTTQPTKQTVTVRQHKPRSSVNINSKRTRLPSKSESSIYRLNKQNSATRITCDFTLSAIILWINYELSKVS